MHGGGETAPAVTVVAIMMIVAALTPVWASQSAAVDVSFLFLVAVMIVTLMMLAGASTAIPFCIFYI